MLKAGGPLAYESNGQHVLVEDVSGYTRDEQDFYGVYGRI